MQPRYYEGAWAGFFPTPKLSRSIRRVPKDEKVGNEMFDKIKGRPDSRIDWDEETNAQQKEQTEKRDDN